MMKFFHICFANLILHRYLSIEIWLDHRLYDFILKWFGRKSQQIVLKVDICNIA